MVHISPSIIDGADLTSEQIADAQEGGALMLELRTRYPSNNYTRRSNKFKIEYFETNKIRKLLARYYNTGGYPVKFYNHVGYFSGVAQWVPDQWMIEPKLTRDGWISTPSAMWAQVCLLKIDIYDTTSDAITASTLLSFINAIPGKLGTGKFSVVYASQELAKVLLTPKWVSVYPNLLFYNTINDKIIWANWNLVLSDLNKIERLKYLPSEADISEPVFPTN